MISSAASAQHDVHFAVPSSSIVGVEGEGEIKQEGKEEEREGGRKKSGRG